MKKILTDFSAGEFSEKMKGRFDLPAYSKACLTLENMMVTSQGMISKRAGTEYVGQCRGLTNISRIIPFVYSDTESYVIELIAGALQLWRGGSVIASTETPGWSASEIWEIQYAQDHRGLYMVHPSMAPVALIRTAQDSFSYGAINWLYNAGGSDTSHAADNDAGDVTLIIQESIGATTPQQGLLRVKHATGQYDEYTYTSWATSTYSGVQPGLARDYDGGDTVIAGNSYDSDDATTPFSGANNYPRTITIFAGRFWFGGSNLDRQRIWASAAYGDTVDSGSLYLDMRMYKTLVSKRQEQTDFAGWSVATEPETEEVTYTRIVISDDVGIQIDLGSDQNDTILWMAPGTDLFVGTTAAEWVIPRAVTARQIGAIIGSRSGSAAIQPHFTWDILPFMPSSKKQLRAYRYDKDASGGYKPPDLTRLADQVIGASTAREYDVQKEPRCMIYVPRVDGQIAVLTYEPDAGVLAWQRWIHSTNTTFLSVAVIPESGVDTVYCTVKRGSNYFLEKFADPFPVSQSNIKNMDSLYDITADDLNFGVGGGTFQAMTWLASLTVTVVEDGLVAGTEDVDAAGDVDLSGYSGSQIYIGLPFTHKVETMPIVSIMDSEAFPMGEKRVAQVSFRLYRSMTLKVIYASWTVADADTYSLGDTWYTGDVEVDFPGDYDKDATIRVVGKDAYPLTIQAIMAEVV